MQLKTNNGMGSVYVSNNVIAEIAGAVTSSCYGVVGMASHNMKDGLTSLIKAEMTRGISVLVQDSGIVVDIHIIIRYGVNINAVCRSIVNRVRYALVSGVGLKVSRINVRVEGVKQN